MKNTYIMEKRYLSAEDCAELLQCNPRMVLEALRDGRLKGNKPVGKWLVTPAALDEFVTGASSPPPPVQAETQKPSGFDRSKFVGYTEEQLASIEANYDKLGEPENRVSAKPSPSVAQTITSSQVPPVGGNQSVSAPAHGKKLNRAERRRLEQSQRSGR